MNNNKKILIAIALISAIYLFAYFIPILFPPSEECYFNGECKHEAQLSFLQSLIPIIVVVSVIIGAFVYYLMAQKVESKQKSLTANTEIILKLLNSDERKIIDRLIREKGKVFQSELSRIEGIGKLKSHRILQRLSDRKVIEIEPHGKTNIIRFTKELEEGLLPKA